MAGPADSPSGTRTYGDAKSDVPFSTRARNSASRDVVFLLSGLAANDAVPHDIVGNLVFSVGSRDVSVEKVVQEPND